MKNVALLLFLLTYTAVGVCAQDSLMNILPMKDGRVYYEGVVIVDTTPKKMLYQRAKRWAVDAYRSAKDVIQLDDPENGELTIKGTYKTYWQATFMSGSYVYIDHTIHISIKDGKYRYQITDLVAHGYSAPSKYSSGGAWEYLLEKWVTFRPRNAKKYLKDVIVPTIGNTISSLNEAMNTPIASNQDW